MGRSAGEGEGPVSEMRVTRLAPCLSTPGHEESWRKQGGPPSKAEYVAAQNTWQLPIAHSTVRER